MLHEDMESARGVDGLGDGAELDVLDGATEGVRWDGGDIIPDEHEMESARGVDGLGDGAELDVLDGATEDVRWDGGDIIPDEHDGAGEAGVAGEGADLVVGGDGCGLLGGVVRLRL